MTTRRTVLNTIAVLTFSTMLVAAQTQMPPSSPAGGKSDSAATKTLTGIVSDSMCGAHHMEKDKSPAECTRMCVKQGQKYGLVVGEKLYTLEGHEADLDKLAGQRVAVKGAVRADTVTVASVSAVKR